MPAPCKEVSRFDPIARYSDGWYRNGMFAPESSISRTGRVASERRASTMSNLGSAASSAASGPATREAGGARPGAGHDATGRCCPGGGSLDDEQLGERSVFGCLRPCYQGDMGSFH